MAGAQPAGLRRSNQFVLQRERRYHPGYYAAFVLDPDGNNIKAVYHGPVAAQRTRCGRHTRMSHDMAIPTPSAENLKRPLQPMPDDIARLLAERGLERAYAVRPAYQRNDYLGWIARAKRPDTRQKRIDQMLDELERGDAYMRMAYDGPRE